MSFNKILIAIVFSFIATQAFAIDGYKDLKFGITQKEVLASNLCSFESTNTGYDGVEGLGCSDFKFGNEITEAYALFINDQFLRFLIIPSVEVIEGLSSGLVKKYGAPSSSSTPKEFTAVDSSPNQEAFIAFDNNTIYLKIMSDETNLQSVILIYTSPRYDILLGQHQEKSLKNDL